MPTHGSLTKAGRVRNTTPEVEKTAKPKKTIPRKNNRRRFLKAVYNGRIS